MIGKEPIRVLDVASGTGDIAYKIIENQKLNSHNPNLLHKDLRVTLSDVNSDILKLAKEKMIDRNVDDRICNYIVSSAE